MIFITNTHTHTRQMNFIFENYLHSRRGTAENGTAENGTAKNGTAKNGTAKNGTVKPGLVPWKKYRPSAPASPSLSSPAIAPLH